MRALLIAILTAASATIVGSAVRAQAPAPRVIEINAERFEFWPSEVTIDEGEPVVLHIRSDDTLHGFRIVGTGTNVSVPKRGKGMVAVTPGPLAAGRYTFECSRLCGAGHNFMRGVLVVRPPRQGVRDEDRRPRDSRDLRQLPPPDESRTRAVTLARPAAGPRPADGGHP